MAKFFKSDRRRPLILNPDQRASQSVFGLERDEVHVWHASLDLPEGAVSDLERSLSLDERERAARFRFAADRQRFVSGRGLLRLLAGAYLGCAPAAAPIGYGAFGKPYLAMRSGPEAIAFNLSHAGALVVFAFRRGHALGVDIEQLDCRLDVSQIAHQYFTAQETADIMARSTQERYLRFFEFWTLKEAVVKALGKGLTLPLREFDVSAIGEAPYQAQSLWLGPAKLCLSVHQFTPAADYVGALAVSGGAVRLVHLDLRWMRPQGWEISPFHSPGGIGCYS